jgi:cell division protease FtsH
MAQPDRNSQRDNKRNNEPNFNWRGIVLIAIAFGLIGMALLVRNGGYQNVEDVPYNRFIELLDNKQIISDKNLPVTLLVQEGQPTRALIGYYRKQTAGAEQAVKFRTDCRSEFQSRSGEATCRCRHSTGHPRRIEPVRPDRS